MGWGGGTRVFDTVVPMVRGMPNSFQNIERLARCLEEMDWNNYEESAYYTLPVVRRVLKKLHPDWDLGEDL